MVSSSVGWRLVAFGGDSEKRTFWGGGGSVSTKSKMDFVRDASLSDSSHFSLFRFAYIPKALWERRCLSATTVGVRTFSFLDSLEGFCESSRDLFIQLPRNHNSLQFFLGGLHKPFAPSPPKPSPWWFCCVESPACTPTSSRTWIGTPPSGLH